MDEELYNRMQALDPARLLPFSRQWEPSLPKKDRLPKSYKGSINNDALNNSFSPVKQYPKSA